MIYLRTSKMYGLLIKVMKQNLTQIKLKRKVIKNKAHRIMRKVDPKLKCRILCLLILSYLSQKMMIKKHWKPLIQRNRNF